MKRILFTLTVLIGLTSCENFVNDFPDYDYVSGYFPYQHPVRTLVLGDYIYDNSNDNDYKFIISVTMGGAYSNEKDRRFDIEVDESMSDDILFSTGGDPIQALPSDYYTLSSDTEIVIPKGEFTGGIEVQLTEAFFDDPLAMELGYVIPIRLNGSADVDTLLSGFSAVENPDVRNAAHWEVLPKNFTMFAVKYINELHGTYFHYGENTVTEDASNTEIENNSYSEQYVENNSTARLVTTEKNQVSLTTFLNSEEMQGEATMILDFDGNDITISEEAGSPFTITGSGEYQSRQYEWGNKDRDGIVLDFTISDGVHTYEASDVLVARDRGVVMETYSPQVIE
ncbi:MAG: DUF5627 domain-containing protein [Balneolales bacterium]